MTERHYPHRLKDLNTPIASNFILLVKST